MLLLCQQGLLAMRRIGALVGGLHHQYIRIRFFDAHRVAAGFAGNPPRGI
jgi:hypothetical protein